MQQADFFSCLGMGLNIAMVREEGVLRIGEAETAMTFYVMSFVVNERFISLDMRDKKGRGWIGILLLPDDVLFACQEGKTSKEALADIATHIANSRRVIPTCGNY